MALLEQLGPLLAVEYGGAEGQVLRTLIVTVIHQYSVYSSAQEYNGLGNVSRPKIMRS